MRSTQSFSERVWSVTRRIPRGRVTTYRILAHVLGTRAYRAVGNALHRNPSAPEVPCHRVVCSDGSVGGFARGTARKTALLREEGVQVKNGRIVDLEEVLYSF